MHSTGCPLGQYRAVAISGSLQTASPWSVIGPIREVALSDTLMDLLASCLGAGGHITRGAMYLRDALLWIIGVAMPIIVLIAAFWFH